jgi:hypothetical protein
VRAATKGVRDRWLCVEGMQGSVVRLGEAGSWVVVVRELEVVMRYFSRLDMSRALFWIDQSIVYRH